MEMIMPAHMVQVRQIEVGFKLKRKNYEKV